MTRAQDIPRRREEPVVSVPGGYGDDGTKETHPAFGVAVVTRSNGTPRALFQSDLLHSETITLRIHRADRTRDLNHDWVHPLDEIVEVEMSLAQWGALVSSIGIGSGVPVTLRSTENERRVPLLPHQPRIQVNLDEVNSTVSKMLSRARSTIAGLREAIEEKKGVKAVRAALRAHEISLEHAESNATFAVKSMSSAAERLTSQARADIEAQILNAARLTGLDPSIHTPELMGPSNEVLVIEADGAADENTREQA